MTTTAPRIKAGSAYGCTHAASGCNAPQSECMNLCLHRVDTSQIKDNRVVVRMQLGLMKYDAVEFAAPEPMLPYGTWRSLFAIAAAILALYVAAPYFIRWLS